MCTHGPDKILSLNDETGFCFECEMNIDQLEELERVLDDKKHITFYQSNHSCAGCTVKNRYTGTRIRQSKFIERSNIIHGFKYDYSKVDYKCLFTPVTVICPHHGSFTIIPNFHLTAGCPRCKMNVISGRVQ